MKGSRVFISAIIAVMMLAFPSQARNTESGARSSRGLSLAKTFQAMGPNESAMTINNYLIFVDVDAESPLSSGAGISADYPKGAAGMIYMEGLVWGARVRDGDLPIIRVNGSTYESGLKAGKVLYDAGGAVTGSEDRAERHVWRVRKDWPTATLNADAGYTYTMALDDITDLEIDSLYNQYEYDWLNWPADEGAPYLDRNGTAGYQPASYDTTLKAWDDGDFPGWPGAAQTIFLVTNDLPYIDAEDTIEVSTLSYGSPAIGMEMQLTIWAYDFAAEHPLGNVVFKRARMIYTGLPETPDTAWLDSLYFTQWSDPDLGTYTDDYVGCDVDLSLGYVYNGSATDNNFLGDFGLPVPAGGYDFLQGPIINGDTLGMTSFGYFGAGSAISDPTLGSYSGTLEWWNLMEGFLPQPAYPTQTPWTDPNTGETTIFPLSGDPVTGIGWIDGVILPPGDRRLLLTTGPFTMVLGDTQDVVLACVAGMGQDNISSVTVLKFHDTFAQYAYDNDFDLPSPPATPRVRVKGFDGEVVLDWSWDEGTIASTEETISKGFEFEGYNVYQLPEATSTSTDWHKVATYDLINLIQTIFDPGVDPGSGFILEQVKQSGTNAGVQRFHHATRDEIRDRPITNDNPLFFVVTAYSYLEQNVGSPFKTLESSPALVTVTPQQAFAGDEYTSDIAEDISATHSAGAAGGSVTASIVNPADLTGDDYEVYFDKQHYYRDLDGIWQETNYPDSVGKSLGKVMDISGSSVTGAAIASATIGTIDLVFTLDFVAATGEWGDGFKLTLPSGIEVLDTDISGAWGHYGIGEGQNCVNFPDGLYDPVANTIQWGDAARSQFGCIEGDMVFTVNVSPFTFPITVDYEAYDDGYGDAIVDASGTVTLTELGYEFRTHNHWNLRNLTTSTVLIEDQTNIDGVDLYTGELYGSFNTPIVEGFQPNVIVGYAAPNDYNTYTHIDPAGATDVFSRARASAWLAYDQAGKPFIITSYAIQGWAATARCSDPDVWGAGTSELDLLQADYELRFTGVYEDPVTVGDDTLHRVQEGTGSIATFVGARLYDDGSDTWENHPMCDDVSTDRSADGYFLVRIPFEVWNTDTEEQIDIMVYDREQDIAEAGDFYVFNESARMYCYILNRPYSETIAAVEEGGADEAYLTWNLAFYNTAWTTGDTVRFNYDNPIVLGGDLWTFSTVAPTTGDATLEAATLDKINVFPNPYYGYHLLENLRRDKWVKFNHLPEVATIRIFTLGGVMVRVLEKDDDTQYMEWNLQNQGGFPVASGIYIAHIDLGDLGSKILKLAIVQEEQILTRY